MEKVLKRYMEGMDPRIFGASALRVKSVKKFVRGGFAHTNYLILMNGKRYIARFSIIHKHGFKLKSLKAEYNTLKAIEALGIGPNAYRFERSKKLGEPFIIIDYVDGDLIEKIGPKTLKEMAKLIGELHSFKLTKSQMDSVRKIRVEDYISDWTGAGKLMHIRETGYEFVDREFTEVLANAFAKIQKFKFKHGRECLTHGDLSPRNTVRGKEGLKFIDFESAGIRDPEYDLAYFFGRIDISNRRKRIFLREYEKYAKMDPDELLKYQAATATVRLLGQIWETIVMYKKSHLRSETFRKRLKPEIFLENAKEAFIKCKRFGTVPKGARFRMSNLEGRESPSRKA